MSTLSGNATKGEKGKKFQQLKILLPSGSKSTEPEQQPNKSSTTRIQHGMTSLGKVPTARRPTNLPSEKSEQSGNDPTVNLVPSGGPGWGNKANETGPTTPSLAQNANPPTSVSVNSAPMPGTSQPVQHVQPYPPTSRMPPMPSVGHVPVHGHPDAKSWARMTFGGDSSATNAFTPQSPLFHHEFPSLSSNAETSTASTTQSTATVSQKPAANSVADTQYGPGPSLRPQVGSWMSGSRPQGAMVPAAGNLPVSVPAPVRPTYPPQIGPDGARNNLAPSGVGVVPAGPYHSTVLSDKIPPPYATLMPTFVLRNSFPGPYPPNVGPRSPYGPYMPSGQHAPAERFAQPGNSGANSNNKRAYDDEDTKIRSIIKEEDLNQMANIGNDIGWAGQEDIDYNQKLKFSDDEDDEKNKENRGKTRKSHAVKPADKPVPKKDSDKENDVKSVTDAKEKPYPAQEMRNVWQARKTMIAATTTARYQITAPPGRFGEDDEDLQERRKQKKDEMEIIIQRARERREEEEKRYREQLQQAANLKLKKLDERILAEQRKAETKEVNYSERDIDMLPEWEKEKIRAQNKSNDQCDDSKKSTATLVPVVKDASEFRALTQLGDRNVFTKKEREQNSNFSRAFSNNVPPRFQNLNRQISGGAVSSQSTETRKNNSSQFSNKSNNGNFSAIRRNRLDSDSTFDKDREWNQEEQRKERYISDERFGDKYRDHRELNHERDDDRKFSKEYENDKRKFYEKNDYVESYREFDRDSNYNAKTERKSSESERSDKSGYDRRFSENETHDKESISWRHEESPEKSRHFATRSPRAYSDNENHERKRSRDEGSYEKNYNADRDRDYYRKETFSRAENEREKEHRESSADVDAKRDRDGDKKEKDERKSPSTYEERISRNELRESRYTRESRESLRDETYTIREERTYSWADEGDVEEKPVSRRYHFRDERGGDRYSHAQRHPPGPITREKLEAKELEDSKRNLTALVRSDKETEPKKSESGEKKDKESGGVSVENVSSCVKQEEPVKSVWNKERNEAKSVAVGSADKENKEKDESKESTKISSKDESSAKAGDEKRADRKKNERAPKRDNRSNWARHPVYRNPYGSGRNESKVHRSGRLAAGKGSSRRDSKYSESDYSDEISGSGREDRISRNERDERPTKSKRYERDDRNEDYRLERDYMSGSRGGRYRDYYKPAHRGRVGFRGAASVGKRMDGYGPPPTKSPFSNQPYPEERRQKYKDSNVHDHPDKKESHDKNHADGKSSNSRSSNDADKNWKKNDLASENKSTVSSPTSVQTAEGNEESFATASEGTDSEDNQATKSKQTFGGTKRQTAVVVTKPQRRNYRSTSRKRFEARRSAPLYSRKDTGSYSTGKRTTAGVNAKNTTAGNKENDKYSGDTATESGFNKGETETRSGEKSRREYADGATKKNVKSRNRSNSRKNIRNNAPPHNRPKNAESSNRTQGKKKSYDSKSSLDYKESRVEIPVPLFKEPGPPIPAPPPAVNAWDKPLRTGSPSTNVSVSNVSLIATSVNNAAAVVQEKSIIQVTEQTDVSQESKSIEKITAKVLENLDGSSPPSQTIIFENTNFKSAPGDLVKSKYANHNQLKNHKDVKMENFNSSECGSVSNFSTDTSTSELPNSKHDPLQMALSYKNEDASDMKLDFAFDSEFSKLTDDNKSAKSMELSHTMHMVQASTDADLNFKIASVKKVWDGSLVEHFDDKYDGGMVNTSSSFSPSFSGHSSDPNGTCYVNTHVESSSHVQMDDVGNLGHNEVVFSPVSQIQGVNSSYGSVSNCPTVVIKNDSTSSSSNVCKVKPQPQGCSTNMANVVQSAGMSATLVSQPPPMSSPSYTFGCSTPQPNLNSNAVNATALAQINYQAQYGNIPPVQSPPVLYNSSQAAAATPGLYQQFQIENPQVAARSQFGQFAAYGLSGAINQNSTFNQPSMFVQPPPSAPPPDLYSAAMPPYRLTQPFGNSQQITSPSTVLISSTSNSLMSAAVKPSNQQIGAIGTKTGFAGAQSSPPLFIHLEQASGLLNQNFIPGSPLIQRPGNNVVPPSLQGSTSFYTTGSGVGQTGFFQPGTNSPLQPQPGPAISLPAFNTQSATPSLGPTAIQNFGSQLTQQFRTNPASYLKGSGNQCNISSDFGNGKTIALSNQHDPINSVFPAGTQMSSPKPRIPTGGKAVQNMPQAMGQHAMQQNSYSYQSTNQMRNNGSANKGSQYPHPIQRPVSQGSSSNRGCNTSNSSASHRMPVRNNSHQLVNNIQQQPPSSVYYTPSSGYSTGASKLEASSLDSKTESTSDSKLADSIKTINSKNVSVSASEKTVVSNE